MNPTIQTIMNNTPLPKDLCDIVYSDYMVYSKKHWQKQFSKCMHVIQYYNISALPCIEPCGRMKEHLCDELILNWPWKHNDGHKYIIRSKSCKLQHLPDSDKA